MANFYEGFNVFNGMRCDGDGDDFSFKFPSLIQNLTISKIGSIVTSYSSQRVGGEAGGTGFVQGLGIRYKTNSKPELQKVIGGDILYLNSLNNWVSRDEDEFLHATATTISDLLDVDPTGLTLKTTASVFNTNCVGVEVKNLETGETRTIVEYTNNSGVEVDTPMSESWHSVSILIQSKVSMVDYLNKMYYVGSGAEEVLKWNNESTSGVVTGNYNGKYLGVANGRLAMAGFSDPRVVIFSKLNSDRFYDAIFTSASNADVGGANTLTITTASLLDTHVGSYIYNTETKEMARILGYQATTRVLLDRDTSGWDNDVVHLFTDWFVTNSVATGIIGLNNYFAIFDVMNLYLYDIASDNLHTYENRGTLSSRSIAVSEEGLMFWTSPNGQQMLPQNGSPVLITAPIINLADKNGIFDLIEPTKFKDVAGGVFKDIYYLSVGELTEEYDNYDLGSISTNFDYVTQGYTVTNLGASVFVRGFDQNGKAVLYFGSSDTNDVYKLGEGSQENINWKLVFYETSFKRIDKSKSMAIFLRYRGDFTTASIYRTFQDGNKVKVADLRPRDKFSIIEIPLGQDFDTAKISIEGTGYIEISSLFYKGEYKEGNTLRT